MAKEEIVKLAPRPVSPSPADRGTKGIQPYELDAELAQLKIVEVALGKMPTMAIISKPFIVRQGIFTALNHTPMTFREIDGIDRVVSLGNPTGYDSSLRLAVYDHVARHSVNNEGELFHSFWAFAMKPKLIIQGMNQLGQPAEEEGRTSIFDRVRNWFGGGEKKE